MTFAYTPKTLADRWAISAQTIRDSCQRGEIDYIRVGSLCRIPHDAVTEYERCQMACASGGTGESSASSGMKEESIIALRLERMTGHKPNGCSAASPSNAPTK